jgi:LuxR family maltose regulon positive regulatory protein
VFGHEAAAQALTFHPSRAAQAIAELDHDRAETQVLRARLALQQGDDRAAAALLVDAAPPTTRRELVERRVLLALSVLSSDVERAKQLLGEALEAAQPEGLIRTVIEQGPGIHRLLRSFGPEAGQERYIEQLIAASGDLPPAKVLTAQPLVEPLSTRELMVLRYLCTRLTYREIAAALFVSRNTLKSHVRSVYRKLAVESRADAVEAGRNCGLI